MFINSVYSATTETNNAYNISTSDGFHPIESVPEPNFSGSIMFIHNS